jgi:hypothetical protein
MFELAVRSLGRASPEELFLDYRRFDAEIGKQAFRDISGVISAKE